MLVQQVILDNQVIHLGAHEAAEGILRRAYDGLAAHIKRGVDEDEAICLFPKSLNEVIISRMSFFVRLSSSATKTVGRMVILVD